MHTQEREARREAEIKGLREALSNLQNDAAFLQKRNKRHIRGSVIQ